MRRHVRHRLESLAIASRRRRRDRNGDRRRPGLLPVGSVFEVFEDGRRRGRGRADGENLKRRGGAKRASSVQDASRGDERARGDERFRLSAFGVVFVLALPRRRRAPLGERGGGFRAERHGNGVRVGGDVRRLGDCARVPAITDRVAGNANAPTPPTPPFVVGYPNDETDGALSFAVVRVDDSFRRSRSRGEVVRAERPPSSTSSPSSPRSRGKYLRLRTYRKDSPPDSSSLRDASNARLACLAITCPVGSGRAYAEPRRGASSSRIKYALAPIAEPPRAVEAYLEGLRSRRPRRTSHATPSSPVMTPIARRVPSATSWNGE